MQTSKLFIADANINLIPTAAYSLEQNEIKIHTIYLPDLINLRGDLSNFLNKTEIERAERFHKEIDASRFVVYRAILKIVLAAYTKLDAKNISLEYGSTKKPYLSGYPSIHFNISHSQDFAVIAISDKKIGIDIEYISDDFNFSDIMPDIFKDREISMIQNSIDQKNAFYKLWTRKEAFVKGIGIGINESFKHIPCLDGEHTIDPTLLENAQDWQVFSFEVADHYRTAVAIEHLSPFYNNIKLYKIPNTISEILEITQITNKE